MGQRQMWDWTALGFEVREQLFNEIRSAISDWTGVPRENLERTAAYGVRIYKNGSVLNSHVDHLGTHVLSAVYCVAIDGEEKEATPWYLEALPDLRGKLTQVNLRPGQLFLYESAKLPHGRTGVFRGDAYAAMFTHFKPRAWGLTRYDRVYVLPSDWENPEKTNEL